MNIEFNCPKCRRQFHVEARFAGRKARCKDCGESLVVPLPPPPIAPMQPSAVAERIVVSFGKAPAIASPVQAVESFFSAEGHPSSPMVTAQNATNGPVPPVRVPLPAGTATKLPMRTRRLLADASQMSGAFQRFPPIQVLEAIGNPPELYRVLYRVRSLARGPGGQPLYRDEHHVEIQLTRDYPRQSPKCKMLTPIFHPNIEPTAICVGDHWTAGERLIDLVIRIGEMLAYQAYNIKSPLDGEAAMWSDMNRHALPTDPRDLRPKDFE